MKQLFIENRGMFSLFRLSLFRIWKKSSLGNPLFRYIWTWEIWERYEYDKIEHLRRTGYGYRKFPYPNTSKLIDISIYSSLEEEIIGASRLLFSLEFKGMEYRDKLISRMEQSRESISAKRFELIYEYANLCNYGNLRDIIYKSIHEINSDLAYYQALYQRTHKIKEKITAANN